MGRNIANRSSVTSATIWKKVTNLRLSLKLIILAVLCLPGIILVYTGSSGDLARLLRSANLASWIQSSYKEARAERQVLESWQRITQAGQYDFSTTVEQVTYPAPKLSNVGSSSTRDVYHISGRADLAQRKLLVSLWQNSGSLMNTQDGLEIRIEDSQTWGRTAGGEWRKLDSFSTSAFAPGNDAASFLSSARNVHLKEYVALNLSPVEGKTVQLKSAHYTFDVDSNRLAAFMRDQMVAELQRAGKLPAGLHLDVSDEYRKMTGNGDVWIGADGLPLRISMVMKFPAAKTGERIEAHLSTDFFALPQDNLQQAASLFPLGRLGRAAQKLAFSVMVWLDSSSSSSSGLWLMVASIVLVLFFAAALRLAQRDLKNSLIYRLVACLVILSTLATPLWDGSKAQAYNQYAQSQAQQQAARQRQSKIDRQSVDDMYSMDWDPQVNPYAQVEPPLVFGGQPIEKGTAIAPLYDRNFSPLEAEPGEEEADADKDGVTDDFENKFDVTILNPNNPDTDSDGLKDGEELKLGLMPGETDSDNDKIRDIDEAQNWYGYDRYWWTNPMSKDTDKDGILDGVECPERVPPEPIDSGWTRGVCRDIDLDNNPDVFDQDDDGDGVPSIVDASPYAHDIQVYSQTNPYKFSVTNLATDDIFITYQLKPTNPEHLTYSMNVLDWPSGDTDGQIMRISETTFADQMSPDARAGDPKADKGDLRLIPMVEVRLTGSTLPLQLTNMMTVPVTSTSSSGANFSGIFRLTAQSGSTQVTLVTAPAGAYPVYQGKGTCDEISNATSVATLAEGGSATISGTSLGDFAQGDRVLYVMNAALTDVIACAAVQAVAHATLTDQVVDSTLLENYAVSARNDTDDSVLLYAPLSLVYDYAGGTPTAFQSKIPFTNVDGRMSDSHQAVRAVWLVAMLTDVCKPRDEGFTGEWCTADAPDHWYTDQSRVVQTYNEEFNLAGVSVQEDLGLNMAVVFEDPQIDPDPQYDDPLWGLSHGLQGTFLAARDSDGDGVRDVKVSDLANRFDASLNGCPAPDPASSTYPYVYRENNYSDWGLPCNSLKVLNYQYDYADGVHDFMQRQAQQVFADYFNSPPPGTTPSYVNLLFAREMNSRMVSYGDNSVTCGAGECTYNFEGQDLVTQAVLNWSPYKWDGSAWSSFPLEDYLDVLESNLRVLDSYKPADESLDAKHIVDGQIYMARFYFEGLYRGVSQLVALNGNPVINIPQELRDDFIYDSFYIANGRAQIATKIVTTVVEMFLKGMDLTAAWVDIFYGATKMERVIGFFKTLGAGLGDKLSPLSSRLTSLFRKIAFAVLVVVVVAVVITLVTIWLLGPDTLAGRICNRILFTAVGLISMALGIYAVVSAIQTIGKEISSAAQGAAIVGAIIGAIITWGVFIYSAIASGVAFGSLAMNNMVADAIAATCTIILLTAISFIPVAGPIIVGIIAAIDGLITAICYAAGAYELEESHWARQYICIGISGWITKIFKWIIYSSTYMVDYGNSARLEFTGLNQSLQDWTKGMVAENPISYTLDVSNYITLSDIPIDWKAAVFFWQYSHSTAKSSTFNYKVQPTETDIHDDLERGDISDLWQDTGRDDVWVGKFEASTDGYSIAMPDPGINRAPVAYFSEGSAIPVQECLGIPLPPWWYPVIPVCYIRTERASIHSDLSASLTVDVFPKTLDEFYSLVEVTPGGYSFSWGRDAAITFPTFHDSDGDGLTSTAFGGNDADDSRADTDSDGLTDYYEVTQGLNPRLFDTDDDGLIDSVEVNIGTDALRKDSDGDGLTDAEELQGWLFTYAFKPDGAPLESMVYSDPLMPDSDFDGVTDLQEKIYGFNPNVAQNNNILDYSLSTREFDSPLVLLHFDEDAGASSFEDASHFGYSATCDLVKSADACPVSGMDGRYSNAISLDGNDYLILSTSAQSVSFIDNRPFTLAAWVSWDGSAGSLISKWNAASDYKQELRFEVLSSGALSLINSAGVAVNSSGGITNIKEWTHVAVSFDGSQASFTIDGLPAGGGAWSNTPSFPSGTKDSMVLIGASMNGENPERFFAGRLDEVSIIDRAFSTPEIVMRLKDARYNLNDRFVRPGEDFFYQSVIENLLNSRFAYGLLKTLFNPREAITDWMNKLLPRTFQLKPDNPVVTGVNTAVISDTLHIEDSWTQSGNLNIKQTVTAQIVDQRAESNFASLWLKFNEGVGSEEFADSSGSMPPRDAQCNTCPTSGETGILNNSVKFSQDAVTPLPLPDLNTMDLVQRGYTIALWVKPESTSLTSPILTLLKSENNQLNLSIRKNSGGQYVPQVYVNGSDVTPGLNNLWRVMLPDVWNHLVVRYSSNDQRLELYLNGARVAVFTSVPAISANDNLSLGGTTQSVNYWVDDLRIFNRTLSITDLNRLAERTVLQLQMDSDGFSDSSVYNQMTNKINTPHRIDSSVRGSSLHPGVDSSLGYLKVNGNDLLDMQDGAFTYAVWIHPTNGGTNTDWEGIFGYNSGTSTAYPGLERKGARLRFGFGDGSNFQSKESGDVLNDSQWYHIVVSFQPEFDLNGAPTGNYLYKLYVNSTAVDSNIFTSRPASSKTIFVGHSSKSMTVTVNDLYVTGIRGDAGDWAEVWMKRFVNGGFSNCFWPSSDCGDQQDVQGTNTYGVNYTTDYSGYENVSIEVWESDWGANPDDHCGDANYYWYDLPKYNSTYMSDGVDGNLHSTLSRPSTQFFGYIDELEVYRYGLDSEQVFDLYNAIPITARLPLDDRPASDSFDNRAFVGEQDNGVCTAPACPAAGTVGLINQDVTFDGADDLITIPMVSTTPDYMVSLWLLSSCSNCGVYTLEDAAHTALSQIYIKNGNVCVMTGGTEMCTQGNGFTNEQWHHVVYANNGSVANLWLDGSVVNTISGGATLPSSPGGFARLGYAPQASQDYLYGQLDDVRVFRYSQDASMVALLKRQAPLALFHLDEETASAGFADATPADWALDCAGACPQTYLPGRLGHTVEFTGTQQLALRQSQLSGTTKSFSAETWVYPTRVVDQPQTLWVLGNGSNSAPRYSVAIAPGTLELCVLKATGNGSCAGDSVVGLIQNVWNHVTLTVDQPIPASQDAVITETVRLYVNGYQDSVYSGNSGTTAEISGLGKLWIGDKPAAFSSLAGGALGGRIDEVTIFEDVVNEIDVRDTFRYQMSQVEEFDTIDLTIDAEPPSAELISYNPAFPYLGGSDTLLQVNASDATSAIGMVEMRTLYHGAPHQDYQVAPVCMDSSLGTSYCPTFNPDAGDGTYELSFRAVDLVGHQAETQNYPIFVDNAGPQINCDQQSAGVKAAQLHPYRKHTWVLHLSGSIYDESLSDGVAGSGVYTDTLRVTIFSANGEIVGQGAQIPTLTSSVLGYNWELDYLMPEVEPTGKLTVLIEGLDKVGNRGSRQFDLLLDATAPRGHLNSDSLPGSNLSDLLTPPGQFTRQDTLLSNPGVAGAPLVASTITIPADDPTDILITGTLSGTISDIPTDQPPYITTEGKAAIAGVNKVETAFLPEVDVSYLFNEPYPDGLLAWLTLDQDKVPVDGSGNPDPDSDERLFIDISPAQNAGTCVLPDCPIAGIEGHKMGSIYFSGTEQYINLANQVDLANRSFSVSIWAQRDQIDRNDPMLWQGPVSVASKRFLFGVNDQNRFVCGFGGSDLISPLSYPDTGWHHWTCSFDMASSVRTIYRDGQALASDTATPLPAMYENLFIGLAPVGDFKGHLDELQIFDRALNASQVREQYTAYNMVYHLAVVENWYADGDLVKDSSGYFHDGRLVNSDPNNKVVAGKVGDFALKFDGDDRLVVPADPATTANYSLRLDRGAFTQAAWIYPQAGSGEVDIISQRDENPEMRYPSLLLTSDDRVKAGFGDFYNWHEIETPAGIVRRDAWNFVAATFDGTKYRLYVNGVLALESADLSGLKPYASQAFNIGDGFTGQLDDVRIFTRALDSLEIQALMGSDWRLASLQGSGAEATWTNTLVSGLEGPYHIGVRGWDSQGHYDTSMLADDQWGGVVDTLAPRIQMVRTPDPVPTGTYTVTYSFSIEDSMLREESILENMCSSPVTLTREYYNSSWYLAQALPPNTRIFRVSGECQGDIRTVETVGIYACDLGGNCASATFPAFYDNTLFLPMVAASGAAARQAPAFKPIPPAVVPPDAQPLLERSLASAPDSQKPVVSIETRSIGQPQVRNLVHILLKGAVWDDQQVAWVQVRILKGGQQVYSTRASLYGGIWNALWAFIPGKAPEGGTYTVEVTAADLAGNLATVSQGITVDFTP